MSNKSKKNKKKNAAAKQKAAAAYMSKKNAPVQKSQPQKPTPKPDERDRAKAVERSGAAKPQPKPAETAKRAAEKKAPPRRPSHAGKTGSRKKKLLLNRENLRPDRVLAAVLVLCALIAGVVAVVYWRSSRFTVPKNAILEYRGINCSQNELYAIPEEEDAIEQDRKASEMKREGDTEMFAYYAVTKMVVPDKGETGWLNLTNVFNNKYILMATIVDETGTVCAHTRGIPAGYRLGEIKINYSVPFGTHKMHLVVSAYDIKTRELVGVQYSDLTVQVGTEEEMTNA